MSRLRDAHPPAEPMSPAVARRAFVGDDVVDIADSRCFGKGRDPRFLGRVLAPVERAAVEASRHPDQVLWRLWAAKEAAFKVVSKLRGAPPPFVHEAFRVDPADAVSGTGLGEVRWEQDVVRVRWHSSPGRIVTLAWDGAADEEPSEWGWGAALELDPASHEPLEELLMRLSDRERSAVHSRGSALVRLVARGALARALGVAEPRVAVVCGEGPKGRTPPEAWLDDAPAPADVSLSHHGRWLAWAVRLASDWPR